MPQTKPMIGILGGGQLAQMLTEAARNLPVKMRVLVNRREDALPGLENVVIEGNANDPDVAVAFARSVDIVTLESEFIDPRALEAIEHAGAPLFPTLASILLIQDKWHQKQALMKHGLPVTACAAVDTPEDVQRFAAQHGWPVVLKRRHLGYDGKGNATVRTPGDLPAAWKTLHNQQGLYVEAFCPFQRELAVMVCRSTNGETAVYPVVDTVQENHICKIVRAPSNLPESTTREAHRIAVAAIESIGGIGTMGVEMFLRSDGSILINELAPRVHNSGHYTIEGCACSQFENHLRAILGMPLGSTSLVAPAAVMINLLGAVKDPSTVQLPPGAHLHLYGKKEARPGRKMGHVTALGKSVVEAEVIAKASADLLQ